VCGDATMAYRPTVDQQFLDMLAECKIAPTPANGYGDGKLKLFERHVTLVQPDTVVIYDVLESEQASQWTLLLHAMKKPSLDSGGMLSLESGKTVASGVVVGSQPLTVSVTDQFYMPPVDLKKKYKDMPRQYHISYVSQEKSKSMRFVTVLQMADTGAEPGAVTVKSPGIVAAGGILVRAELDANKPEGLSVKTDRARLYMNQWPEQVMGQRMPAPKRSATVLVEKHAEAVTVTITENMAPIR